jgi:hypothetical protein
MQRIENIDLLRLIGRLKRLIGGHEENGYPVECAGEDLLT